MKKVLIAIMFLGITATVSAQNKETKTEKNKSEYHHESHGTNHEGSHDVHNAGSHEGAHANHHDHHASINMDATYTFLSISTAKPGKLDDLVRIASAPSEKMDEHVDGLLARQISVDTAQNSVVVWVTFDKRESMMNYMSTEQGQNEHGDSDEMDSIIATFKMYDLTPKSQRLIPKH